MIKFILIVIILFVLIGGRSVMATSNQIQFLDTLQGSNFLAIQSAMEILKQHHPDLTQYRIEVIREGNSEVIILADKAEPTKNRENFGVRLESKVVLSAPELRALSSGPEQTQILDRVQGRNFLAIQAAVAVFEQHHPDLTQYKIEVLQEGHSTIIVFVDKDQLAGTKGSVGKSGFEVELNAQDFQVIRSNFVR